VVTIDEPSGGALRDAEAALDIAYSDRGRARRLAERARRQRDADPDVVAVAEHALGLVALAGGDLGAAEVHLRRSIDVAAGGGRDQHAAAARGTLGYALTLAGRTDDALQEIDRAMTVLEGLEGVRLRMQRALILTELGRFDEASSGFDRALAGLRGDGVAQLIEGDIRTNRSILRYRMRDWRGAEEDLDRAEALYAAGGHAGRLANVAHNRGVAAATRGDVPAALAWFDDAEDAYRVQGRDSGLIPVDRAEALLSVRLIAEARDAAAAAVEQYTRQRNAVDLVHARVVLAQAALAGGDTAAARAEAEMAATAAERQRRPGWAALARHVVLRARWDAGDRSEATLRAGQRTIARLDDAGWVVAALEARLIVARVALLLGRVPTARRVLVAAAQARRDGPADLRARAWHAEALLRSSAGDRRGTVAALRQGMRVLHRFRASLGASELRAHVSSAAGDLAGMGVQLAVQAGEPESVLEWAERWRAGAMLVRPARPPDDAALARELAALRQTVAEASAAAADGRDVTPWIQRQAALEESVRRRARHAPGDHRPAATIPTATQLQEALGPRALVEYVVAGGELHALILADARLRLRTLGHADSPELPLRALRYALRRLAYETGSRASLDAALILAEEKARVLDELLLAPLGDDIGTSPLVIVPTGALHALPWAALPTCRGRSVSLAPSATLWHRAVNTTARSSDRIVLAAGPGLPHAGAEVATLARRYQDASRFTGRRATVEAVTAALDGAGLAHVAAHGHFRADNPLFSSIRLHDGPLTVYDLERLAEPPAHVVLSACDSGLPTVHPGDELLGLAAALLAMGTRSLIATVVPVPDDASRPLMLRLHQHLSKGEQPAAALAKAQADTWRTAATRAQVAASGFVCFGAG